MLKSKMYLLVHTLTSHLIRYTLEIARRTLFPSELPYLYIFCAIDIIICNHVMSFISHTTMTTSLGGCILSYRSNSDPATCHIRN